VIAVDGVPDFWVRVKTAPHRLLALDYDGTLAPFRVERMEARPLPGVSEALAAVAATPGTSLLVVSGRPADEVARLLGDGCCAIIGAHGFERREAGGRLRRHAPAASQVEALRQAEQELARMDLGGRGERKVASVAFHTRGLPAARARELEDAVAQAWTPLCAGEGLEVRPFAGGVELRVRGRDKGSALLAAGREAPAGALVIYVGDDDTDEDAFRALREEGIGIRVGRDDAPTAAQGRLPDCEAVLALLRAWPGLFEGGVS